MERILLENLIVHSANKEIHHFLWDIKVKYHACNSLLPIPILCQMNPIDNFQPSYSKISFNITYCPIYA
jgi:hypothetical protein